MGKDLNGKELGEGLSQRKADGRYMARYKGKYRYAPSLKEIRAIYRQLVDEVDNGTYISKDTTTVERYFDIWLTGKHDGKEIKGSTENNYTNYFNSWIKPYIGSRKLQEIDRSTVRKLRGDLLKRGLSPETVNKATALLSQMFKQATEDGIIIINPVKVKACKSDKEKKKATETIHRAFTIEEQKTFMQYMASQWYYNMADLMLNTGMRTGEARALRWCDIDYKAEVIHIKVNASVDNKGKATVTTPKTEKSERDIPLTDDIKAILERQRKLCRDMFGDKVIGIKDTVFKNMQGRPVYKEALRGTFKTVFKKMRDDGIYMEPVTPHALRDTFATRAIENGMTPQTLKTILGHASLSETMDLYAQVLPDTKAKEMKKIAAAF